VYRLSAVVVFGPNNPAERFFDSVVFDCLR
jgi:hypothetical protein